MNTFILVFPFSEENESLKEGPFMRPGCSVSLIGKKQPAVNGVAEIFSEHALLAKEEFEAIQNHKLLYSIQGEFKTEEEFNDLNQAIASILKSGALGVYMEHSGAAWSKASFLEWVEHEEMMSAWLNFIETNDDLYTLGMESFGRPDLCIRLHHGEKMDLQGTLVEVAESLFLEESVFETGATIELESTSIRYHIRKEPYQPYRKDDPEYNRKGVWRLVPKK
ncbi:MAG TPA: DUF4261 domain-containing protein [Fibrobacteraceae bacterium]|nr:DUF4261 domain-containing protein [Fibrobacteraceae bacterium]HPW95241.1 DUF4261 domain-containing protein [Fibrobacteraceae bacterium]